MKLKLLLLALTASMSASSYADDFFTVNRGSPTTNAEIANDKQPNIAINIKKDAPNEHAATSIEQHSDFIRNIVAKKQMSLYNFSTNKEETFSFEEIDNDVNYARKFIPPSEDVIAMFDFFVAEGASPGTALLLTYKKLDEAIQSINNSSANK